MKVKEIFQLLAFGILLATPVPLWADGIHPEPQIIERKNENPVILKRDWVIEIDRQSPPGSSYPKGMSPYLYCAQELKTGVKRLTGVELDIGDVKAGNGGANTIVLGNPLHNPHIEEICKDNHIDISVLPYGRDDPRYFEGYVLDIGTGSKGKQHLILAARGPAGLSYGVKTLLQLIGRNSHLKAMRIVDYPDFKWRGAHLVLKHYLGKKVQHRNCLTPVNIEEMVARIDELSDLKANRVSFQSPVFNSLSQGKNFRAIQKLFNECRKRFIIPIPLIKSKSRGFLYQLKKNDCTPLVDVEDQEAVHISDEPFVADDSGRLVSTIFPGNMILNPSFEKGAELKADNWEMGGKGWSRISRTGAREKENIVHSGSYAVRVRIRQNDLLGRAVLTPHPDDPSKPLQVIPGSYYELSLYARMSKGEKGVLYLRVYELDAGHKRLREGASFLKRFHVNKKWRMMSVPIFTDPRCVGLRLEFEGPKRAAKDKEIVIDDIDLRRMDGQMLNVLYPPNGDIMVTSLDKKTTYKEGADYLVDPAPFYLGLPYKWHEFTSTRIRLTPNSSIRKGQTVALSYDCTLLRPRSDEARSCPSSPGTYVRYRRLFKEVLRLDPKYIHIDQDELRGGFNRDSRCLARKMTNAQILASFINSLDRLLHEEGDVEVLPGFKVKGLGRPDVRLIMWDDMVNPWHNGGGKVGESYQIRYGGRPGGGYPAITGGCVKGVEHSRYDGEVKEVIYHDVILDSWYYHKDRFGKIRNSPRFYEKLGYDFFVSPWSREDNVRGWASSVAGTSALGITGVTWGGNWKGLPLALELAWNNRS